MKNILAKYKNGNYNVLLLSDGTKIRYNHLDNLTPSFAESIDCTITTKCDGHCSFCYLNCTEYGTHADLNQPFFDTLHEGTELALNGNDLSHPDLESFLIKMKNKGVFCNLTVNQKHFLKYSDKLLTWSKLNLINGLGISLSDSTDSKLYTELAKFPNAVIHSIDGLLTKEDIDNLSNKNIKLLILGYKILGRGDLYYTQHKNEILANINWLKDNIMMLKDKFYVISFDNLAIDHLEIKTKFKIEDWSIYYMGDEGKYTFFVDLINKKFAISSLEKTQIPYTDNMTIDDMFKIVRSMS